MYHSTREIIEVVDVMYLKAQNLAREMSTLNKEEIKVILEDLRAHARQIINEPI